MKGDRSRLRDRLDDLIRYTDDNLHTVEDLERVKIDLSYNEICAALSALNMVCDIRLPRLV